MLVQVDDKTSFKLEVIGDMAWLQCYLEGQIVESTPFHMHQQYTLAGMLHRHFEFYYSDRQKEYGAWLKFRDAIDEAQSIDFLRSRIEYDVWVQTEETYLATVKTPKGVDLIVQVNKCWNAYDDHAYIEIDLQERGTDMITRFLEREHGVSVQDAVEHVYKYVEAKYGG